MNDTNPRLRIETDGATLVLSGEVDAHTAPELAAHLDPLPGDGDVVLDLGAVEFIDSSGLRVLVETNRSATEADRRLVLRSPSPAVLRLLEISGLTGHLHVES